MTANLFLFATIAGSPIAVRASEIEAVVRLGEIVPIQRVPPHVHGHKVQPRREPLRVPRAEHRRHQRHGARAQHVG